MSLISDALKTAQRQRTASIAAPVIPPFDGFFPHADANAPRAPRMVFAVIEIVLSAVLLGGAGYLWAHRLRAPSTLAAPAGRLAALPAPAPHIDPLPPAQSPPLQVAPSLVGASPTIPAVTAAVRQRGAPYPDAQPKPPLDERSLARPAPVDATRIATEPAASATVAASPASPASVDSTKNATPRVTRAPTPARVQVTVEAGGVRPVDALMTQALAAQRQGDLDRAKQLYDRAIKVGPASAALYNNYGALLTAIGDPSDAVAMLRLALTYDQAYTNAWVNLGNAQDVLGDHSGAVAAFNRALRLDPINRDAKVNLASQYVAIGSPGQARELLETVTQSDPNYPTAHYVLAQLLESDKDIAGAIREFTRFLELGGSPGSPGLNDKVRAHINALKAAR